MKGENHLLAVTTTVDPITNERKPLFGFPVQICKATEDRKNPLQVAAPSGAPREQIYRDTATGEIVSDDECLRGTFVGDEFKAIPTEAITEAKGQKSNLIVAEGKVPLSSIDFTLSDGTYFVQVPAKGGSAKAYRLTYESLLPQRDAKGKVTREARALVAKRTARTNEKLVVIYADEDQQCLKLVQLLYNGALREPDQQVLSHLTAHVEQKQIDVAVQVIDSLPDATEFIATAKDDNAERIEALIEKAIAGESIVAPEPIAATVESDDLEAALLASLSA